MNLPNNQYKYPISSGFNLKSLLIGTVLPVFSTVVLFVCAAFFIAVPTMKDALMTSQKEMIRELTNSVWALLNSYDQKVKAGELSIEEAQQRAISHIGAIQFGKDQKDYFWINNMEHTLVMHPYRKDLVGRDLTNLQDANGVFLFQEIVRTVENQGQGYVEYLWQWQDDPSRILPKISFVKGFGAWNWIIGTGIYPLDVYQKIDNIVRQLQVLFLVTLVIIVVFSYFIIRQARKREFARYISLKLLRESELRYGTLIEQMNEGLLIQDENDHLVFVNQSFCKMLGFTREEILERKISEFLDDKNFKILTDQTLERIKHRHVSSYNLAWKGKNDKVVYTKVTGQPYIDPEEKVSATFALVVDITEQKKKDLALKESEEKFRETFETSPHPIAIINKKAGTFTDLNKGLESICGYWKWELLGEHITEIVDWSGSGVKTNLIRDILKGNHLVNQEIRIKHKKGKISTLMVFTKDITLQGVPHIVCFGRDITEKLEAEEKYHSILKTMKDGYMELDLSGRYIYSNESVGAVLGYSKRELQSLNYRDYISESDLEHIQKIFGSLFQTGEAIDGIEAEFVKKDGSIGYAEFSAALIKNTQGRPLGFSGIFRDITARKVSEKERDQMRIYLQNTIDLMPSILIVMDAETKVTQWNLEAEKYTRIPFFKAQGQLIQDVLVDFKEHLCKIKKVIKEKQPVTIEKFTILKDNVSRFYNIMIYPIHSVAMEGAVLRIDDTSERVRLEEMMIQSEKMMSVGELAAGTAHEINNPIGGILQATQNISRRISSEQDRNIATANEVGVELGKVREYLDKQKILYYLEGIRESSLRAADIVSRMLQFSRKSQAQVSETSVSGMIDRSIQLASGDYDLKKGYDFKKIKIEKEIDPDLKTVPCVEMEIEQVILNILKNAAQAMAEKKLQGYTPKLSIKTKRADNSLQISVEDNGPGMEENIRKRVFEPFFTTKPIGKGTGLGLSVSYMIVVNNHQGQIEVDSVPSKGTTFHLRLPLSGKIR